MTLQNSPSEAPPPPPVSAWRGEFTTLEWERAYRADVEVATAQQQRVAFVIWGAALLGFALPDYLQIGPTAAFWALAAYRVAMAALLAVGYLLVVRQPALASSGRAVMWLGLVGYPFFFLFYVLRPELRVLNTGMIMLLQLSLFVFLPGRALAYVPVAAFGVVGAVITLWAVGTAHVRLWGALFALTMPAVVGYALAVRLQRVQRLEFQMRSQLQAANEELKAEVQRRIALEHELQYQATTDMLTRLPNRRAFEVAAERELSQVRRSGQPLTLALVDVDHFKRINDTHGHAVGDEVLRAVGRVFGECFRREDCVGRIGGEEFALLLPGATLREAEEILRRFLDRLGATDIRTGSQQITVTATVGLADYCAERTSLEALLNRADAALYAGKHQGRNRVIAHPPEAAGCSAM